RRRGTPADKPRQSLSTFNEKDERGRDLRWRRAIPSGLLPLEAVGRERLGLGLERDDLPVVLARTQRSREVVVQGMARLAGHIAGQKRLADQVQVADRVQDLVLDELVLVAQAVAVEYAVFVHDDGVVQAAAPGQPGRAQGLDLVDEAEGARARD